MIPISIRADRLPFPVIENARPDSTLFPTKYRISQNKLFYWYDDRITTSKQLLTLLNKYNKIDSVKSEGEIVWEIDHNLKAIDYYFCKDNPINFEKIFTLKAIGYYKPPKLKCK